MDLDLMQLEDFAIEAIVLTSGATEEEAQLFYSSADGENFFNEIIELIEEGLSPREAASDVAKAWAVARMDGRADRAGRTYLQDRIAAAVAAAA